jgi:dienelactone hydrolase
MYLYSRGFLQACLILFVSFITNLNWAQSGKPPIDLSVYHQWPYVTDPKLSDDGKYFAYNIQNQPEGSNTLVVRSIQGNWQRQMPGGSNGRFCISSQYFIYQRHDSMLVITTGSNREKQFAQSEFIQSLPIKNGQWIALKVNSAFLLYDLTSGKSVRYENMELSQVNNSGTAATLWRKQGDSVELLYLDLFTRKLKVIFKSLNSGIVFFSANDRQLAFKVQPDQSGTGSEIWLYGIEDNYARKLLGDLSNQGQTNYLKVGDIQAFSKDCSRLFFSLDAPPIQQQAGIALDIWSYKEKLLQSEQLKSSKYKKSFMAVVDISTGIVKQLEKENNRVTRLFHIPFQEDKYLLSAENNCGNPIYYFKDGNMLNYCLISTETGQKISVPGKGFGRGGNISPLNKFYVYYSFDDGQYYSYEIQTGITRNITKGIDTKWDRDANERENVRFPWPITGWLANDQSVLLRDEFDVWQLDLLAKQKPLLLTGGEGKRNKINFEQPYDFPPPVWNGKKIVLAYFNSISKVNGFYSVTIGESASAKWLSGGNYHSYANTISERGNGLNEAPLASKNGTGFIVGRMSASQSYNYWYTKDFVNFIPMSNIYPEKNYNWYGSELVTYQLPDGSISQGALYKPDNFDSLKKYPVLVYIYEKMSDQLNIYRKPACEVCNINIPTYVSNGYLVFTPDIRYTMGEPGESIVRFVAAGVNEIKKRHYVDGTKIGLQGCSFGGYEANYLITHSDLFAAVCTASGTSDLVSHAGVLRGGEQSNQTLDQNRMGILLGKDPEAIWKNSPISKLENVKSPLLLMHTSYDGAVEYPQAIEMFTGLWAVNKRVWLLEYNDADHGLLGKSAEDFSVRMLQFFNHYLKDSLPPKWMTEGRPASLKGIDEKLDLDTSGLQP